MMKDWVSYKNGNYRVFLDLADGTKIRANDLDELIPDTVESMDIKITNQCDKMCSFCLRNEAKLYKESGSIRIADATIGDSVLSYNVNTKQLEYKSVLNVYRRPYSGKLITITTESGKSITCTPNHKIYTNRGYVRADELKEDDELLII